jgi:hypothetical protein
MFGHICASITRFYSTLPPVFHTRRRERVKEAEARREEAQRAQLELAAFGDT